MTVKFGAPGPPRRLPTPTRQGVAESSKVKAEKARRAGCSDQNTLTEMHWNVIQFENTIKYTTCTSTNSENPKTPKTLISTSTQLKSAQLSKFHRMVQLKNHLARSSVNLTNTM